MSDKHLQTRKTLQLNTGIFGISSLALVGGASYAIISRVLKYGLTAIFGTFSFWALLAFIIISIPTLRGAFKAFRDLDYSKSKRKAWLSSLSVIGLALVDFLW